MSDRATRIVEQPFKIPFLAALVLAINCRKTELASEVINQTRDSLQKALENGDWRDVKLFVRFLSCLQGLFKEDGVFPLLEELFSRAVDLQTASSEDSLGLELVKIILLAIPYVMSSSATDFESHATNLLEKTDIIASTPHTLVALVDPFAIEEDNPEVVHTFIGLLQRQLQDESSQNWKLNCLPRPWKFPETSGDDNTISLESSPKISFPEVNVPNPVKQGPRIILPEIYLSMYAGQEFETVPPTSNIASTLLRDVLTDTINVLDFNRVAAAKYLIDVDCYCAPDIFVKRATPFDKLRDIPEGRTTWKPEDIAVDAVFSQLFQLPVPEHKFVYYHSVLTECCKIAPAAIAPSLGRAIRYLYRNTEKMDLDLVHRFVDWFAHHLSNFGFTWKWTEW
jgi:nuclear cap-binding protein subunit 1